MKDNKMKLITTTTIKATDGKKTIAQSKDIFTGWIDSDFKKWGTDKPQNKTKKTNVDVWKMTEDATFKEMMGEHPLCLTQSQIIQFVTEHKDLCNLNWGTFFPFKVDDEFFVAYVRQSGGELRVYVYHFGHDYVWFAGHASRVVLPQQNISPSDMTLSSSDTLEKRVVILEEEMKELRKFLVF